MFKRLYLVLLLLFVAIQFIHPGHNLSPGPGPNDIAAHNPVPPEVSQLLQVACYDCHSNNTRYPWYASVQPVGWWLAGHIHDAKRHLNFSEFDGYSPQLAAKKLDLAMTEVREHDMPLHSYTLIHADARLTPEDVKLFCDWAEATRQRLLSVQTKPKPALTQP